MTRRFHWRRRITSGESRNTFFYCGFSAYDAACIFIDAASRG
jgi:hypothetical protein